MDKAWRGRSRGMCPWGEKLQALKCRFGCPSLLAPCRHIKIPQWKGRERLGNPSCSYCGRVRESGGRRPFLLLCRVHLLAQQAWHQMSWAFWAWGVPLGLGLHYHDKERMVLRQGLWRLSALPDLCGFYFGGCFPVTRSWDQVRWQVLWCVYHTSVRCREWSGTPDNILIAAFK